MLHPVHGFQFGIGGDHETIPEGDGCEDASKSANRVSVTIENGSTNSFG